MNKLSNLKRYQEMFECIEHVSENKEFHDYTVCGSDGVTYQRKWELDYHNCQHDSKLRIRHPGCDQKLH